MAHVDPEVLLDFIDGQGLSYKKNSVSFIFTCPRCSKKDKLYLRRSNGQFICFKCAEVSNFRGRPEFALAELCRMPLALVKEALYGADASDYDAGYLDFAAIFGDDDFGEDEPIEEATPTVKWPGNYYSMDHRFAERGAIYLEGRGIPRDIALAYDLRFCPEDRRVGFPITMDGQLVGWQARLVVPNRIWNEELGKWKEIPKVLSSKDVPREKTVMFENRLAGQEAAVLCEGPIDALKAHLCPAGNVAAMGKAVSRGQIRLLRDRGIKRIYLALDPDAVQETARLVKEFSDLECYLMEAPKPWKDLGEMPMEAVLDLFRGAQRVDSGSLFVFFGRH